MKSRWLFLAILLPTLITYTCFKAHQLLPDRKILAWGLGLAFFMVMVSWQFIYRSDDTVIHSRWFQVLTWIGSFGMGLWGTFFILSFPFDLGHFLIRSGKFLLDSFGHLPLLSAIPHSGTDPLADPGRRTFLSQWLPLGLLGTAGGMAGLGFLEADKGPRIKKVSVPIDQLPQALEGLKIAQISDLHVGPTIDEAYAKKVVDQVLSLKPDLIAITGDLADGTPEELHDRLRPLTELKAPLGTYYVTGNHEYYWGGEKWIQKARELGFIPLVNENRTVTTKGHTILIAGVTDTSAHQFVAEHQSSPKKAGESKSDSSLRILLAHRPDSCLEAEPAGFDLQLSGHTHAGQFFPWNLVVRFAHQYYQGLNRHHRLWVYVNAGTGYWGPANRFLVPSEITLLELKASSSSHKPQKTRDDG